MPGCYVAAAGDNYAICTGRPLYCGSHSSAAISRDSRAVAGDTLIKIAAVLDRGAVVALDVKGFKLSVGDLTISNGQRFGLNEPAVVADVVDGETIIMNLERGDYYSLNQSGGELWALLVAGLPRADILQTVARRHDPAPSGQEIDGFIGKLLTHSLIVPVDHATGPTNVREPAIVGAWSMPELSVYSDMKELLAMDPPLPPMGSARN